MHQQTQLPSPRSLRIQTIWLAMFVTLSLMLMSLSELTRAQTDPYAITTASFLGDASSTDRVRGARIQSDGTIVVAANIGSANPGGVTPILLNGASVASRGAIIRLSADGQTVVSVTRFADQVEDVAIDNDDTIYVAAWDDGMVKLNPAATDIVDIQTPGKVLRVDAGGSGYAAALVTSSSDPDRSDPGSGTVAVYTPSGMNSFAGRHNTLDVCLDPTSQTVVTIGWRQARADGNPVQIAYLRGSTYDGTEKYTAYDWSTDNGSDRFINKPTNNMADTRGYRCAIGRDGKLYAAFETAGGNHIFRYSPFDIMTTVDIVGGDQWHEFYNTRSEHKTFFARYEPATGEYLLGQQFTNRLGPSKNNAGNTVRVGTGAIMADEAGRVYIGGASAAGLPMPPHERYTAKAGETTFNPFPDGYLGGAWFMVMSADFQTRLYVTRLATGGDTHALDARTLDDATTRIVFAGKTKNFAETYTQNAVQEVVGGGEQDGWFAVMGSDSAGGTPSPDPSTTATPGTDPVPPAGDNIVWLPLITKGSADSGENNGGNNSGDGLAGSFRTSVTPTEQDDFASAEFSLWIPDNVSVVRGIIMYGPGCGASSLGDKPSKARAAFAEKWGFAFLGMQFVDKSDGKFCGWSRAGQSGADQATLQALQNFADQTSRPELTNAPWLLFGMSGGAGWAMDMAILYPDRTIAAFPRGSSSDRGTISEAYQVPIMMSAGENDGFAAGMISRFDEHRPQGALWSLAITPNEGHTLGKAWDMALIFFDSIVQQRLPESVPEDGPVQLLPINETQVWLGDNTTSDIAPESSYSGDKSQASLLPDETTAQKWQQFVTTGQVD